MKQFEAKLEEQMRRLEAGFKETNSRLDSIFHALAGNAYTNLPAICLSSQQQSTLPKTVTQQSQQKKKRNQKTRLQYKRRRLQVVQEVEDSGVQLQHSVDQSELSLSAESSKQVVPDATRSWTRRSPWWLAICWRAVILWDEKKSPVGSTQNECGLAEMPRNGIG